MDLKGKKVLVTGGAGFIGSHLVDVLIEEGCFVRVLDDLSNGKLDNLSQHKGSDQFEIITASILDASIVEKAVKGIDVVYHLACLGVRHSIKYPFENHRVNAEGTLIVLQAARAESVDRFIYCSSSEIYGTAEYVPMPESHPKNPCTVYGASKLAGEGYVQAFNRTYGYKTVVIRPFNTYGPRSHHESESGEMIPKFVVRALNNESILVFGDGLQTRDFTYVEDTARGLLEAGKNDDIIGQILNIGSNFEISVKQVAEKVLEFMPGSKSDIQHDIDRPGDVLRLYADPTKFINTIGWKPRVSFDEGLLKTINWFKSRPEKKELLLAQEGGRNWI